MKVSVVTACGNKKEELSLPAWKLYKSPRIKAVYNRKGKNDMFILSAEHGLIPAEKITAPYNRLMDETRCQELIPKIKETIKNYDAIVFFKAGSRKLYERCIAKACEESGVRLISFGYGFMAGINDLPKKLEEAGKGM
ncbi:MAG: DUF6884 domain-containing protein [Candidatus Nitrosopumilus sp. bin_68KS]